MNDSKTKGQHIYTSISSFCSDQEKLLIRELAYLKENGGKKIKLSDGVLVESQENQYVYSFESDIEVAAPNNTKVYLWPKESTEKVPGIVVSCEEFTVIVAVEESLGANIRSIEMSVEAWFLLQQLVDRLDELKSSKSSLVYDLVCNGKKQLDYNAEIATGQEKACEMSCSQPITFVWGPPGTGKTETLAKIALSHIAHKKKVLMLSYSNVSVDGAIWRVYRNASNQQPGKLIRYGYPRDKTLVNHEDLNSYNYTLKNHPDIKREREQLIKERKSISRSSSRYVQIGKRLNEIRKILKAEEQQTVEKASFVATTVSKAIVDPVIYEKQFDTVIFDEASMAYIPQIIFSAGLAAEHFVCMGDFAQLPPIVQNSNSQELDTDIFDYCGIVEAVEEECGHNWLCLLDVQYRMHPDIAAFSSKTMYHDLLRSAEGMADNRQSIVDQKPLPGTALNLVDLSGMLSVCRKTKDNSRINLLSGIVSMTLALNTAQHSEVGVITPYRAQSQLLHALARDLKDENEKLHKITCATVHQFQGSEQDVIIYDAVDCYRMSRPGMLLTSRRNNLANRLYNVALTRAKGKLISVVNLNYMLNKKLPRTLIFRKMLDEFVYKRDQLGFSRVNLEFEREVIRSYGCDVGEALQKYREDLESASKVICMDIPGKMAGDNKFFAFLADLLTKAKRRGVKLIVRAEDKDSIPSCMEPFIIEGGYVTDPYTIIDRKTTWYGMPPVEANFISGTQTIITQYKPIFRIAGKRFSRTLYGLMDMKRSGAAYPKQDAGKQSGRYESFASYVEGEVKCSQCGHPMKLRSGKTLFLGCSHFPACKNTEVISVDLVEKYLHLYDEFGKRCPQDHSSLEAKKGKYGVYVQCRDEVGKHTYNLKQI